MKVSDDIRPVELHLALAKKREHQLILSSITGEDGTPMTNATGYYTLNRLRE